MNGDLEFSKWLNKLGNNTVKLSDQQLETLQTQIISDRDPAAAYFFSIEFKYKPHQMQRVILEAKKPKYAFLFAQNVPNADIKALQQLVIKSKSLPYMTKFAHSIPSADRKLLEKLILNSSKSQYAHTLLIKTKPFNISKVKQILLASNIPRYLFDLAKKKVIVSAKQIAALENLIIRTGSATYIRMFAAKIKGANVNKLEKAILATNNGDEIRKFAQTVRKSKMRTFLSIE